MCAWHWLAPLVWHLYLISAPRALCLGVCVCACHCWILLSGMSVKKPEGWTFPYFSHWLLHLWMFSSIPDSCWRLTTGSLEINKNIQLSGFYLWRTKIKKSDNSEGSLSHYVQLCKATLAYLVFKTCLHPVTKFWRLHRNLGFGLNLFFNEYLNTVSTVVGDVA